MDINNPADLVIRKYSNEVTPAHGLVCLANAASFQDTFFSQELTTFSQGWRDTGDVAGELEFVAPQVEVPRRFEFRKFSNAADFMVDSDDERAPGADFKRVKFGGTIEQSKTINRGLCVFVDKDEVGNDPTWQQRYTSYLLRRMNRSDLKTAADLLIAAAANTGKTWGSSADPDADLMDLINAAGDDTGLNPNRIYMGSGAWAKRVKAYRAQDNAGAAGSAMSTPEQVAQWLSIDRLFVSRSRYQSAASAKANTVGSYVVGFMAESGGLMEDPSNIKRFVSRCSDGSLVRVYVHEIGPKLVAIYTERYVRTVVVSSTGLKKLTIS